MIPFVICQLTSYFAVKRSFIIANHCNCLVGTFLLITGFLSQVNNEEKILNTTKAVIGRNIEDGKSTCILNECKNGAVCSTKTSSVLYSYTCLCKLGWQGSLCDQGWLIFLSLE